MTAEKDVQVARKRGRGEVIWAMPERKHSFSEEVFPYATILVPVSSSNWESNYYSLSVLTEPQNNMTQLHTLNAQFKLWLVVHFVYVHLSNELVG